MMEDELMLNILKYKNARDGQIRLLKQLVNDTIKFEQEYRWFKKDYYLDFIRDNLLEISKITDVL